MEKIAPVFVKLEDYKDIMNIMTLLRERIRTAKLTLDKIAELKSQEDSELSTWAKELEDVETRVNTIDKTLIQPNL